MFDVVEYGDHDIHFRKIAADMSASSVINQFHCLFTDFRRLNLQFPDLLIVQHFLLLLTAEQHVDCLVPSGNLFCSDIAVHPRTIYMI
ncbi:hypothetical protein SDC9_201092 [bioreactor metagenome]|uniref:Uncharacterized protein n=1 Tax=bioreactor metagenome TaxID=1076179 RepID=A0A645IPZ8_9ZZZZ